MDRQRAKELLPIIQAFADGKNIQVQGFSNDKGKNQDIISWSDDSNPDFENICFDFRIKPEPLVLYVNTEADDDVVYRTKKQAEDDELDSTIRVAVKMVEEV